MQKLRTSRNVVIRPAREEDLPHIRQLVHSGLFEIYPSMYRKTFLPSALFQIPTCLVAFCASTLNTTSYVNIILVFALAYAVTTFMLYFLAAALLRCVLLPKEIKELYSWSSFKSLYLERKQSNFWVAETEASTKQLPQIVGTVGLHAPQEKLQKLLNPEDSCHSLELRRMSVHKDYRGTGLAHRLIATINKHAASTNFDDESSVKYVVLATSEFQLPAQKLYTREGFKQIALTRVLFFGGLFSFEIWCAALALNDVQDNKTST